MRGGAGRALGPAFAALALAACAWAAGCGSALAQDAAEASRALPDPLTLADALKVAAQTDHPDLASARADVTAADAQAMAADAGTGINASVEARGLWVEPSAVAPDQSSNDSQAALLVTKKLYDFGRTDALRSAAEAGVRGSRLRYTDARNRHRIAVLTRFFNVLLADLDYQVQNEAMAVRYVNFDRIRDRNKLGQVSDVDLLKAENAYQRTRSLRYAAQSRQRTTRVKLAEVLGRPGMLPDNLTRPKLPGNERTLPELEQLNRQALAGNPVIRALRARLKQAREQLVAARAGRRPVLSAEAEAATYHRDFGSRDPFRAGLILTVPLYSGGAVAAQVKKAQAALDKATARLGQQRIAVRQAVADAWARIQSLKAQRQENKVLTEYRDLYLDRSRALYELEVRADLGDSMVRYSEARLHNARTEFHMALAWARLAALTADPAYNPWLAPQSKKAKESQQ